MSALHVRINQWLQVISARVFIDKERKEFTTDKPGCRGIVDKNVNHVLVVKIARVSQVRFDQVIVILRVVARGQSFDVPAGECRRTLVHILLRVVTKPQGEQFHQFTRVIFVWRLFCALGQVEIEEHGRIARDA